MVCYVIKHKTKCQNNSTLKGQFMDWIINQSKCLNDSKKQIWSLTSTFSGLYLCFDSNLRGTSHDLQERHQLQLPRSTLTRSVQSQSFIFLLRAPLLAGWSWGSHTWEHSRSTVNEVTCFCVGERRTDSLKRETCDSSYFAREASWQVCEAPVHPTG